MALDLAPWLLVLTLAAAAVSAEPVRLPNGEPLVCIYYFGHWWDPWKSDDEAIRADFQRLRAMGFNTILVDHEWSQAIDGDWKWLDREHRLAKEAGLAIVPWLSLKSWSDVGSEQRLALAQQWYGVRIPMGVAQDGSPSAPPVWHDQLIEFGARYSLDYLDRYHDQALLHLRWNGEDRPVICLGVEAAWVGGFDEGSNARFRTWLLKRYGTIDQVNAAWGTQLASFDAVDPRDTTIFDYAHQAEGRTAHAQAVEDHVEFRSQTVSESLGQMADKVRERYPKALFLAEVPYQYGSRHPHAVGYRIGYGSNPSTCDFADLVLFRNTGPLDAGEAEALQAARAAHGQKFILTYRTYSDWDVAPDSDKFQPSVETYAGQAAQLADGFGFYSWNEMVDVHLAYAPNPPKDVGWTRERAERATGLLAAMVGRYLQLVGR